MKSEHNDTGKTDHIHSTSIGSLETTGKNRLEYFSDAVIAIIMTIMVLELKAPHSTDLVSLKPLIPKFLCYILSFVYLATYWTNHHHLMHSTHLINGKVLLANLHMLFWLTLIPFQTAWLSENRFATVPAVLYGINLFMCAFTFDLLTRSLSALHGKNSVIAVAVGKNRKGKLTLIIYTIGIAFAFLHTYFGFTAFIIVAAIWVIPDRRFEKYMQSGNDQN